MPDEEIVTPSVAAKMLRVSPKTVKRWSDKGLIPHSVTLRGHRRFLAKDIEDLKQRLTKGEE